MPATDPHSDFLRLSAALTGFTETELAATGMADTYRSLVAQQLGEAVLARLAAQSTPVLDDEELRGPARSITQLWYLGSWPSSTQPPFVVSARAYAQGLLWRTFGGHAPSTAGPGHGSWSEPPTAAAGVR